MSGMLGSTPKTNAPVALAGIQVQTSAYGLPVPIVYGASRVSMNLIEYTDFKAIKSSSGGGKSGKSGGSGSYTYTAAVAGAICEGPIVNTSTTWVNETAQPSSGAGFAFFDGALGQSSWSYLTANHPDEAVPYSGICYAGFGQMNLSSSATVPNYAFEIYGRFYATAPNGADADPSLVLVDLLSNAQYGAGFPTTRIGTVVNNSEGHVVPASGPYTVTVTSHATFDYNLDVETAAGIPLTCVAASPGPFEYALDAASGIYTFNAAQASIALAFNYVSLGDLSAYRNYCLASGLWISPAYSDQVQTSSLIDDIATYTNSEVVWSCGVLTIVPRGSAAITANGYSYTPPATAGFDLGDDDFIAGGGGGSSADDPVLLTRKRASDQINDIKLEYLDRANQYATSIAEITDRALIDTYGRRADSSKPAHLFCDGASANASAQLLLQKEYVLNSYAFALDARYCLFDPMDLDTITDGPLGLFKQPVRIVEITENDDGSFAIVAEEYPAGLGETADYSLNQGSGYVADYNVSPGSANAPLIYEPPPNYLAANSKTVPQIMIGASGSNPNWGGCDAYISLDNVDYQLLGHISVGARQGVTTATFAAGSDPDTTHTLAVDLTQSRGVLASVSTLNADNFISECLCLVQNADGTDAELVSFATATLTAANKYSLTYLRRGVYGTASAAHASGSVFCLLDDTVFSFPLPLTPVSYVGKTLYIKLLSVNIYGGAQQSLADVSPTTYVPTGMGAFVAPPSGIAVTMSYDLQTDGTVQSFAFVSWTASPEPLFDQYELQYAPSGSGWAANLIKSIVLKSGSTNFEVKPVQTGVGYDFRVRALRSAGPAGGPFASTFSTITGQVSVGKTATPNPPTGLVVTPGFLLNTLTWSASPDRDVIGYLVYRYDYGGGTYVIIAKDLTTTYVDQDLIAGTTYYYLVEAIDTSGNPSSYITGNGVPVLISTANVDPNAITNQVATFGYGGDQWVPCFVSGDFFSDSSPLIYCTGATVNIEVTCTIGNAVNPASAPGGYPTLNGYPFDAPAQIILDLYRLNFGTGGSTHIAGVVLSIGGGAQYTDPSTGVTVTNGTITFSTQDTPAAGGYEFTVNLTPYGSLTTGTAYNIPFSNFTCTVLELKR